MTLFNLQERLQDAAGKKFQLKINDNRWTMLSVRWEPDCTKVSLHRMFLTAPQNIMEELACYFSKEGNLISPNVKAFIEDNLKTIDYSHTLNKGRLSHQGEVYNLQTIYNQLNREYFNNELRLAFTWFGKANQRNRSKVTFGLYQDSLKLIKIHKMLDNVEIPEYFVSFVMYHEMLHYVCPGFVDAKGIHHTHNKAFKEKEAQFRYYALTQQWIQEHQANLFI
jgi:hypothetical protein